MNIASIETIPFHLQGLDHACTKRGRALHFLGSLAAHATLPPRLLGHGRSLIGLPNQSSFYRIGERIDRVARFVSRRRHDRLNGCVLELIDGITFDVVELDLQHARLSPFPLLPELDVANDRLERGVADVVNELAIIEALGGLNSLT